MSFLMCELLERSDYEIAMILEWFEGNVSKVFVRRGFESL